MDFDYLILPSIAIGLLLIFVKNVQYSKMIAIAGNSCVALLTLIVVLYHLNYNSPSYIESYIEFFNFQDISYVTAVVFCFSFITGMFFVLLKTKMTPHEIGFIFMYFACALGAVLSDNLVNLFIYWELLALFATAIILQSQDVSAKKVAFKYIVIHLFGGTLFMIGIIDYFNIYGTDLISEPLDLSIRSHYFILIAILINLGLPPFSSWLTDGYSKSSHQAAIFLSIFTTKVALFTLLNLFSGNEVLLYFGIIISLFGGIASAFTNNFRKLLSLSIIHQMGLLVISLAYVDILYNRFIISFLVVSILYKLVFFMIASILFIKLNSGNLKTLHNTINAKSVLGFFLIITAIQSLGLPFTAGFITKSYISDLVEASSAPEWLNYVLIFLTSLVALNVGIKIPYVLLNFKNNSQAINLSTKKVFIPLTLIVLFLQLIFIFNMLEFLTIRNIIHAFEIFILAIIIYYLNNKFIDPKIKNIQKVFTHMQIFLKKSSLNTVNYIVNINYNNYIVKYSVMAYQKIMPTVMVKNYFSTRINLLILITLIAIYIVMRILSSL